MFKKILFNLFCVSALISSQAIAFDGTIKLPANRTSGFATFSASTDECHSVGKPTMSLPVKPQHGTVTFKWIPARPNGKANGCHGKMGHVMGAFYTPKSGFRGEDRFRIGMSFPKYEGSIETTYSSEDVTIIVQ